MRNALIVAAGRHGAKVSGKDIQTLESRELTWVDDEATTLHTITMRIDIP
jgi:hypothetical protein